MALKMMTLSEIDKKFIDDNMLTDEDFQFDVNPDYGITLEEKELFQYFDDEPRLTNGDSTNGDAKNSFHIPDFYSSIDSNAFADFLRECEMEIKVEPNSPLPVEAQPSPENMWGTDVDVPLISIPDSPNMGDLSYVLPNTPPTTPPSDTDVIDDSPTKISRTNPVIVSVTSLSGASHVSSMTTKNSILSTGSDVKIQPKIVTSNVGHSFPVQKTVQGSKPIILNPDQLVKLTNGTLKLRAPVRVAAPTKVLQSTPEGTKSFSSKISMLPVNGISKSESTRQNSIDVMALRRKQRMIRNRESACLSRRKKKEYLQKLEADINEISAENMRLKEENSQLKLKISGLEKEIMKLKSTFSPKTIQKTACFMVVLFMITFNFASYSELFNERTRKPLKPEVSSHVGRTLLWEVENEDRIVNRSKAYDPSSLDPKLAQYVVDWDNPYNSSCPNFINKTESLRLESDLLGWVQRVEKKQKLKETMKKRIFDLQTALPLPKLQPWSKSRSEHQKDIWAKRKNRNEILIYQTPRKDYEDFFDAIHRRDDTFYFVSFSGDHLLLPAIAHNQTLRPRMSLVMPAMTFNDTMGDSDENISMMQIDCEVMDTKLVYIKESVIPSHLRQKHNSTNKSHPKRGKYSNQKLKRLQDHKGKKYKGS